MSEGILVLACNAGSATLKLTLFRLRDDSDEVVDSRTFEGEPAQLRAALEDWLATRQGIGAVLHRIVHAGRMPEGALPLDAPLRDRIRHWEPLAPLHNGLALEFVDLLAERLPAAAAYACFDSGLFQDLPPVARHYALPEGLTSAWPLERYGFHGLAHRAQWRLLRERGDWRRVITFQLGGGCSASAWDGGRVLDTSMGFTPLEGMAMATRSGSVDPGILLHLLEHEGYDAARLRDLLQRHSGLRGMSGLSADTRVLLASDAPQASAALQQFCYQARKTLGALLAVLGGVDAISFGGGIGENQAVLRGAILAGLEDLGIRVDPTRNEAASGRPAFFHSAGGACALWVAPVDEMAEMLRQYRELAAS